MQIHIRLLTGEVLFFTPRGSRGGRCKIQTHKPRMQQMVLDHLQLSSDTHFVRLMTEDDAKEMDELGRSNVVKSEYYIDRQEVVAFVESFEAERETFFEGCVELLEKAKEFWYTIPKELRSLTEDQVYHEDKFEEFSFVWDAKTRIGAVIWNMSHYLGIPIKKGELSDCFSIQSDIVKKVPENPSKVLLYNQRMLEKCERFLQKYLSTQPEEKSRVWFI